MGNPKGAGDPHEGKGYVTWYADTSSYASYIVKVNPGDVVKITAGNQATQDAVLKEIPAYDGQWVAFSTATGFTGKRSVSANAIDQFTVPADGVCVWIKTKASGTDSTPADVVCNGLSYERNIAEHITDNNKLFYGYDFATEITANQDLNDLTFGVYEYRKNTTLVNAPAGRNVSGYGGIIVVQRSAHNTTDTVEMTMYHGDKIYSRFCNSGTWTKWSIISNITDYAVFSDSEDIPASSNLNSYTGFGSYFIPKANMSSITNLPDYSFSAGALMIVSRSGRSDVQKMQRIYAFDSDVPVIFIRCFDTSAGTFGVWRKVAFYGTFDDDIPEYWNDEIATSKTSIIENRQTIGNSIVEFFFVTDTHWTSNKKLSPLLIDKISKEMDISDIMFGGDAIDKRTTNTAALQDMSNFYGAFFNKHIFSTFGNHDNNAYNTAQGATPIQKNVLYPFMSKIVEPFGVTNKEISLNYYDNETQKVRFIQFDYSIAYTDTNFVNKVKNAISALESDWTVVLISHEYWQPNLDSTPTVISGRETFFEGILSETYSATIACVLVGHCHCDIDTTVNDIPVIGFNCDAYLQGNTGTHSYGGPLMTAGTATEQSFDVIQIDTYNKHIYCTRVGAGNDRDFSYS